MEKLSFIHYINSLHSEVDTPLYLKSMKPGGAFDQMVEIHKKHNVPFILAGHGIDFALMKELNPGLLENVNGSDIIDILTTPYSHTIPSMHPQHYDHQHAEAKKLMERLGVNTKPVMMFPEFDHSSASNPVLNTMGMEAVLVQDDVNKLYSYRESEGAICEYKGAVITTDALGNEITALVSEGGELRSNFLNMLRGFSNASEFVKHGSNSTTFLTDLEAVWLNDAVDKYDDFVSDLAKRRDNGDLTFSSLEYADPLKPTIPLTFETRLKPKWVVNEGDDSFYTRTSQLTLGGLSDEQRRLALLVTGADRYSALAIKGKEFNLPVMEGSAPVIIRADTQRVPQYDHMLNVLLNNNSLTDLGGSNLNEPSQEFMGYLSQALKR